MSVIEREREGEGEGEGEREREIELSDIIRDRIQSIQSPELIIHTQIFEDSRNHLSTARYILLTNCHRQRNR